MESWGWWWWMLVVGMESRYGRWEGKEESHAVCCDVSSLLFSSPTTTTCRTTFLFLSSFSLHFSDREQWEREEMLSLSFHSVVVVTLLFAGCSKNQNMQNYKMAVSNFLLKRLQQDAHIILLRLQQDVLIVLHRLQQDALAAFFVLTVLECEHSHLYTHSSWKNENDWQK